MTSLCKNTSRAEVLLDTLRDGQSTRDENKRWNRSSCFRYSAKIGAFLVPGAILATLLGLLITAARSESIYLLRRVLCSARQHTSRVLRNHRRCHPVGKLQHRLFSCYRSELVPTLFCCREKCGCFLGCGRGPRVAGTGGLDRVQDLPEMLGGTIRLHPYTSCGWFAVSDGLDRRFA